MKRLISSYKKLRATNVLSNFFNLSSIQLSNLLLLFITLRIITASVGLEGFGIVMAAYQFATLAGTVINYGTGQSGVRDTAYHVNDLPKLSAVFCNTLWIRGIIFVLFLIGLFVLYWFHISSYGFILLSTPIVLAEVFNPLCFFIGIEKIKIYNIYNLVVNIIAVAAMFILIKKPDDAPWVNFILGIGNVITYTFLLVYLIRRFKLFYIRPSNANLLLITRTNFYLTVNNISAHLQQSVIIFALTWGGSELLGAYSLCYRVISQCRNLINTVANAFYPKAVQLYKESLDRWIIYRRKTKYLLAGVFFAGAITIFVLADFIVYILSGEHNTNSIRLLRVMAFVPVISAFNVINILDLLLKNNTVYLFRISTILLFIASALAFLLSDSNNYLYIGGFTIFVESVALLFSEYLIKKPVNHG
ncbi:oligosaccharide flippase family protein [Mucilaginibacter antarcticus]|uniref:Oligosaccharide flippase family protein n=1 Tax=Mucilaginibacter antarcticus TaxID=1855725 RepID=A0ABW5XMH7_9SPHI